MADRLKPSEHETPKSEFTAKLEAQWSKGNFVCVGLDSDFSQIPQSVKDSSAFSRHTSGDHRIEETMFVFNKKIIEATQDLVCAYKPNIAFYEAQGDQGLRALTRTVRHIKYNYSDIPIILDAKRADIGNTNLGYAEAAFDKLGADAITVHPYLGSTFFDKTGDMQLEALKPFLERKDKGIFVLCRTSNPSAGEFQDLPVDLTKLDDSYKKKFGDMDELRDLAGQDIVKFYQIMAYRVSKYWNVYGNVGLVVGATYPEELAVVRKIVGNMPILIPGIGAQGGEIEATVKAGKNSKNTGMIINSSRGIIFASKGADFANAARRETQRLSEGINKYRLAA